MADCFESTKLENRPTNCRPRLILAGAIALIVGVQAAGLISALGAPGFGMDFQLIYTVAAGWGDGANVYDDDVLKQVWQDHGDPNLPLPGRPITPNVYPLTIAPLIWPLAQFSYHVASVVWIGLLLAAQSSLLWFMLRPLADDCSTRRRSLIPYAVAIALFIFSYPMRLNLASLNIAMAAGACGVWAVLLAERRPWLAGALFGVSLVKYSLTAPLLLVLLLQRRFSTVRAAIVTQFVLVLVASAGWRHGATLEWLWGMKAEIAASLASGGINASDRSVGATMFVHLSSLWQAICPEAMWLCQALLGVFATALLAVIWPRQTRIPAGLDGLSRKNSITIQMLLTLLIGLLAIYHRAYDLIPVLALALSIGADTASSGFTRLTKLPVFAALIGAFFAIIPGWWEAWDAVISSQFVIVFVHHACVWSALLLMLSSVTAYSRISHSVDELRL